VLTSVDVSGDANRAVASCPSCGAEYRAEFDTCRDCGVALRPLDEGAGGTENVRRGTIEVVERADAVAGDAEDAPADAPDAVDADDDPSDLFYAEEHPVRIVLARLDPLDAADVAERLEKAGIGARVAAPDENGWAPVVIHDTCLPEAQAILAEMGLGAAETIDEEDDPDEHEELPEDAWARTNRRVWGAGDDSAPTGDADGAAPVDADPFVPVASFFAADARAGAERLADAGIDVRIVVDRSGASSVGRAELRVRPDRLHDAGRILHIEV
jgi:hypothetical protein